MSDANAGDPRIQTLMKDTALMMDELARLSRQLSEVGKGHGQAGGGADGDVLGELHDQFKALQERLKGFSAESKQTISGVDRNVRSNPYVFILCALGLGFLLGKGLAVVGPVAAFASKAADLQSTTAQLKERAVATASEAAQTGLTVLVARDLLLALLTAALGLCLFGLHLFVAKWLDPAASALIVGVFTLIGLGLASWFGLNKLRRKIEAKLNGWR